MIFLNKVDIKKISVAAIITALAFVITMFTAAFKVQFLSLDLKDAVLSIIALLFGPYYGFISVIVISLLEFITISTTGWYGLVMNIISSGTFAIVIGFIYRYKRSFVGAIIAAVCTVIAVTAVMLFANIYITPFYLELMGAPRSMAIELLPTLLLPFNLCKSTLNCSLMLIIYKPLTSALKRLGLVKSSETKYKFTLKSALLTVISSIIVVLIAVFMVFKLGLTVSV